MKIVFPKFGYMQKSKLSGQDGFYIYFDSDRCCEMPCICFTVMHACGSNFNYAYELKSSLFYRELETSNLLLTYYVEVSRDEASLIDRAFYSSYEKIASFVSDYALNILGELG